MWIDFESLFNGLKAVSPYRALLKVIQKNCITSNEDKLQIAHFIVYQRLRSHAILNAMVEAAGRTDRQRFEPFLQMKWAISDHGFMQSTLNPLLFSQWTVYHLYRDTFPLSDSPITLEPGSVMVTLSPRLLLEINLRVQDLGLKHRNSIEPETLSEFRRRTIDNTFREIIFGDRKLLEEWHVDPAFQARVERVRGMTDYGDVFHL